MSEKLCPSKQEEYNSEYLGALARFPKPGAKLRYKGTNDFPPTDVIASAQRELTTGNTYTLKAIRLASSWARISLEETGDHEFALGFFDTSPESTTQVP